MKDINNYINTITIEMLLALRVYFEDSKHSTNLAQDIDDLQDFPERIVSSYPAEWKIIIRSKLCHIEPEEWPGLIELGKLSEQYPLFLSKAKHAINIMQSDKVLLFKSHRKKAIDIIRVARVTLCCPWVVS